MLSRNCKINPQVCLWQMIIDIIILRNRGARLWYVYSCWMTSFLFESYVKLFALKISLW